MRLWARRNISRQIAAAGRPEVILPVITHSRCPDILQLIIGSSHVSHPKKSEHIRDDHGCYETQDTDYKEQLQQGESPLVIEHFVCLHTVGLLLNVVTEKQKTDLSLP